MKILWWRSQTAESGVRLQRPLLANMLQQPELGGADPPRGGAVEERKRLSSIKRSGPLPRFPVRRFLSVSLAGTPFPRFSARRSLSIWHTLLPRFPVCRSLAPMSCPCATPSLRRRALSRSGVLPVRRSLHRSLVPAPCVPSLPCLVRPSLACARAQLSCPDALIVPGSAQRPELEGADQPLYGAVADLKRYCCAFAEEAKIFDSCPSLFCIFV